MFESRACLALATYICEMPRIGMETWCSAVAKASQQSCNAELLHDCCGLPPLNRADDHVREQHASQEMCKGAGSQAEQAADGCTDGIPHL